MHHLIGAVSVWAAASGALAPLGAQQLYERPLRAEGFSARAVVLPARRIGDSVIRATSTLAVEIRVRLRDYVPRDMAPQLLIDGEPVEAAPGAIETTDAVTTIAFIVARPDQIREGGALAVQMGDVAATRARIPGALRRAEIRPLAADSARLQGVPTLAEWLRGIPR